MEKKTIKNPKAKVANDLKKELNNEIKFLKNYKVKVKLIGGEYFLEVTTKGNCFTGILLEKIVEFTNKKTAYFWVNCETLTISI